MRQISFNDIAMNCLFFFTYVSSVLRDRAMSDIVYLPSAVFHIWVEKKMFRLLMLALLILSIMVLSASVYYFSTGIGSASLRARGQGHSMHDVNHI